jgi:hypothetical protein
MSLLGNIQDIIWGGGKADSASFEALDAFKAASDKRERYSNGAQSCRARKR